MSPRKTPEEQDWQLNMRDVRKRLSDLDLHLIQTRDAIIKAFEALTEAMDKERLERRTIEFEEAQLRADVKKKLVDDVSGNGNTTQKIKTEITTQLEAKRLINWRELLTKTVIPTTVTLITVALVTAALAVIFPAFGQFLIDAFTRR